MKEPREPRSAHPQQSQCEADAPRLLRQIQVCRRLGIAVQTWRRWRAARRVPAPVANLPGRPRWREADIEAIERGMLRAGSGGRAYFGGARKAS